MVVFELKKLSNDIMIKRVTMKFMFGQEAPQVEERRRKNERISDSKRRETILYLVLERMSLIDLYSHEEVYNFNEVQ